MSISEYIVSQFSVESLILSTQLKELELTNVIVNSSTWNTST